MSSHIIFIWKKAPFLRLLPPLAVGIAFEWYFTIDPKIWLWIAATGIFGIIAFFFFSFSAKYSFFSLTGVLVSIIFFSLGGFLTWHKDIRHHDKWLGKIYRESDMIFATLDEPPVEKPNSEKANATVNYLCRDSVPISVRGKIIVYFRKTEALKALDYGSQIIFKKSLQEIRSAGNPGGFDFRRYALFKGITQQVWLDSTDFVILKKKNGSWLQRFLCNTRNNVLAILRSNIKGQKELGLAEALLIGYKDDLDPTLVQSYTRTGVVHIIAISGLHLGLIYWLLLRIFKPFKKKLKWLRPILILAGLWIFSLLAGAQASVLRSAVMFTCIVIAESISRKTSMYNTLALSAFIVLCYDPFLLWDVGFQLSYAAVLSIVIFMKPIYNWFYFENRFIDSIWKLNSISIAAQILTLPLSIYHFHQFPNYFMLTNFVAVPLSSLIVLGEIFLCAIFFVPSIALLFGKLLAWLVWLMDSYIEKIESLPFSLWEGLQISTMQSLLMFAIILGLSGWLMNKASWGLKFALFSVLGFTVMRTISLIEANKQKRIIVYNIPHHSALDFIDGRHAFFIGDSDLAQDPHSVNFYLQPTRTLYRVSTASSIPGLLHFENLATFVGKHILCLDGSTYFEKSSIKPLVDLLVISKNPRISISRLASALDIKQIVFDGSVTTRRIIQWKKECDSLGIPYHDKYAIL